MEERERGLTWHPAGGSMSQWVNEQGEAISERMLSDPHSLPAAEPVHPTVRHRLPLRASETLCMHTHSTWRCAPSGTTSPNLWPPDFFSSPAIEQRWQVLSPSKEVPHSRGDPHEQRLVGSRSLGSVLPSKSLIPKQAPAAGSPAAACTVARTCTVLHGGVSVGAHVGECVPCAVRV